MHRKHCWIVSQFSCAILLGVATGCGEGQLATAPARGEIRIDGKPLANAYVVFTPEKGPCATAHSDDDGGFVLSTYRDGDGAVVGKHYVTVSARESTNEPARGAPGLTQPGRSLIPVRYNNSATSGLTYNVTAGNENRFTIVLTSAVDK